jgi:hypothetical protein
MCAERDPHPTPPHKGEGEASAHIRLFLLKEIKVFCFFSSEKKAFLAYTRRLRF